MQKQSSIRISRLIQNIQESATLAVDAKAKELKNAGNSIINFSAGEPDFPTPAHIVDKAILEAKNPVNHKYSPTSGLPHLKEAIVEKTFRDSRYKITSDNVLVTNGGKQAVYQAFATIVNPGDEVLLPGPFWTTYPEVIKLAAGVPKPVIGSWENNYKITVEQLSEALTSKTKILVFVSPSNPTGTVYSEEEVREIGLWAAKNDLWVITDEIYEHLIYDNVSHVSIATVVPELGNKLIILNGVAKTYAMTGWRIGWMVGPVDVIRAATNLQSHTTSNVCNIAQQAAYAALSGPLDVVHEMREAFDMRRRKLLAALGQVPNINLPIPMGAFYVYPNVVNIINSCSDKYSINNTLDLAALILEKTGVALVPGEAFGTSGHIRLSYALNDTDLDIGADRLIKFLTELQN